MTVGLQIIDVKGFENDRILCLRRLFDHKQDRVTQSTSSIILTETLLVVKERRSF